MVDLFPVVASASVESDYPMCKHYYHPRGGQSISRVSSITEVVYWHLPIHEYKGNPWGPWLNGKNDRSLGFRQRGLPVCNLRKWSGGAVCDRGLEAVERVFSCSTYIPVNDVGILSVLYCITTSPPRNKVLPWKTNPTPGLPAWCGAALRMWPSMAGTVEHWTTTILAQ